MRKERKTRNPARTRAHILQKATQIFVRSGYDGTSISDIVRATGFNKRMIYHYFGDKRGLYRAIYLHEWAALKDGLDLALRKHQEAPAKPALTRDLIMEALETLFDFFAQNQAFTRLLMWEGLEGGQISRSLWKEIRGPLFVQIEFLLRQAQQEGILDPKIDTVHLIISFLGALTYYFAYAPSIADMLPRDPLSPASLAERKIQVSNLLSALLR